MTKNSKQNYPETANPEGIFAENVDVDIRGLLLMLWRRKMIFVSVMLIGLSLATIAITFIQPRYTGTALLLVENQAFKRYSKQLEFLMGSMKFDNSFILSEIEVLRSRSLARKVVKKLDLMNDPEFNPRIRGGKTVMRPETVHSDSFKKLSVYGSEMEALPDDMKKAHLAPVVSRFLGGLMVRSIPGSLAIQVEYTSVEPNKAALIANAIVDTYIEQRLEEKFQATKKLTDWLDKRLEDLREEVQGAEAAVQEYKKQNNIVEGTRTVVSAEQVSELNSQLVLAKAKKAEAEARLAQVKKLTKNSARIESLPEIVNSDLIQQLRLQEIDLEGRLSELSSRYGEKHPVILELKSELADLRMAIRQEIQKISQSIESEVSFAEARLKALQEGLDEVTGVRQSDNEAMIGLRELEREAESTQLIFDTFLESYKRSDDQEELQEAEARVISYAAVPHKPSYPNKMLLLSLSAAVSLFIGLAMAILLEKLDNTFRSATQLEKSLRFPCFAMIPSVENMSQTEVARYTVSKPSSTVAESVRTLRMVLNLRAQQGEDKPKVVTVTSSFPGEGKTTLSTWIARLAAKSGEKVILIDADLRRPNIHRSMGHGNDVSLVEYLTGQKELDEVIKKDELTGLHVIYGRSVPNSALDLVSSEKMKKLVASLRQVYDLVVIDSPACLAVSDARVLATMSDQTLYGVAWDRTPREVVASGVKQFSDMNYQNLAFVLTNVNVKRHVRYGYGDTVYYYGRYKEYYAN